ncbi:MAG: ferredoxin--nitrite reductase [Acidobacteria bacterium]|nr:MAG: ferredoxin--nitrite reductase [Acidobacteriota bacterium]
MGFLFLERAMMTAEIETRHSREAVEEEIRVFEERVRQLAAGEITDDQFRPFRLKHGIYGQRQAGFQMVRVKIPSGLLNPEQLRTLGWLADTYSTGRGHVTTRENCQFHFVKMEHVPAIMRRFAAVGLTTREACGNTVRNVTSCALAGVCPTEAFDVTPYALATTRFFLRHPEFHDLPRKFKIAFSGCADDGNCAVAGIHDVGLIATLRGSNGTGRRGFRVLVGGGLGSLPTEAAVLTEFLPEEELIPTIEAILRVFSEHGNRKNKLKARMKFVLRAKGIEEFRRLVAEKRAQVTTPAEPLTVPNPLGEPLVQLTPEMPSGNGASQEFEQWKQHNLQPQRQPGYALAWLKLPAGTVFTSQFFGLADLLEHHQLPGLRIAISQDLVIPWVPLGRVKEVYNSLKALDLATPGARTLADVTGCPGATTCNLGITRSLTLAEVLAEEFAGETDPEVKKVRIKISGCPNSCGQHHIADIGLYGNARKVEERQAPYYQLMLAGQVSAEGVRFGRQVVPVPAKRIPAALRELLDFYRQDRTPGEAFSPWALRTPDAAIVERLRPHLDAAGDAEDLFVDWGDKETYSLKLGRGECAA